jgi:hypothetical protein
MIYQRKASRTLVLFIGIGLLALLMACQLSGIYAPAAVQTTRTAAAQANQSGAQSNGETQSNGVLTLPDPLSGLSALSSYQFSYTTTIKGTQKGQAFESNLTINGLVNGANSFELVQQTSTGDPDIYLQRVVLNGTEFSQQAAGGFCRQAAAVSALVSNQTLKLPPVFGANLLGVETLSGVSANHYQFDQKAVPWQAGQNGKAQGNVWIAQPGGYVLKYALNIQLPSGDFQGTRSWSYALSAIGSGAQISMPKGCLPLITDIPIMDGAAQVKQLPAFQSYSVSAGLAAVTSFYKDKLTAAGWSLLPGVEPAGGTETLGFILNPKDGSGRLAVIQMNEQNGQTAVIVQSAVTKKPIVLDATPAPGATAAATNPTETPAAENAGETPPAAVQLPANLPEYPGATVILQNDQMMMLKTVDSPDKVNVYYQKSMPQIGFTAGSTNTMNGFITQSWTKDQLELMMVIMPQGGSTQISFSAGHQ